jgi:aspartyl/asparaginyl beta-hydroxylase (cupin superfamily)/Flp pilus assembly protein TadD
MSNPDPARAEPSIQQLLHGYKTARAEDRGGEADRLLTRAAQLAPAHPAVLNELGLRMVERGEASHARELFARATVADPAHPALWANLASSLHALGLRDQELEALERALALEPRHAPALLQKGALLEERGDSRGAARIYRAALATVPADVTLPAPLSAALQRARAAVLKDDAALAAAVETRVAAVRASLSDARSRRADHCVDLLTGRRTRYNPQPTFMYFPELPAVEFLDRGAFPWLDAVESATAEIRDELTTAVLASGGPGLEPYVAYHDGVPLDQWKELNRSRRWSAYFLWNEGMPRPEHLARCPRTAAVLARAPLCDVPGHAPTAFFSILDAHTHIPPHTGVTNTRLTVHLPLIVPGGCSFRVGSERREWAAGRAWVFDDTIEHEAWNGSDAPRAVLIFDIWNPYLSEAERAVVRAATEAVGDYYRGD